MMPPRLIPLALVLLTVPACSGVDSGSEGTDGTVGDGNVAAGQAVYENTIADGNSFTCATCHSLTDSPPDGLRRPGHPIGDAFARPSYKNGQVSEMREAANSCLDHWMNADTWPATDQRWLDLQAFLADQAPATAPALTIEVVQPPDDLSGGDATAGQATFNGACAVCHGADGVGTNKALPVAMRGLDPGYVATRVRTSGRPSSEIYDGLTGGIMPFWAADRLSDAELRDLVAWLVLDDGGGTSGGTGGSTGGSTGGGTSGGTTDSGGGPTTGSGCASSHAKVGWVADLSTLFHDVTGQAEIVDDCTVVITDFTYDGTGIDVRLYGGLAGDYDNGFPMTDDLLKAGGYAGEYLVATVPGGNSLDDLDGISVWCVDVGVSFGEGTFAPP